MKYDKKVLKAIEGSIDKWIGIAYEGEGNGGVSDCPLCQMFYNSMEIKMNQREAMQCTQCPCRLSGGCCLNYISPYNAVYENEKERKPLIMLDYLRHLREWYIITAERKIIGTTMPFPSAAERG